MKTNKGTYLSKKVILTPGTVIMGVPRITLERIIIYYSVVQCSAVWCAVLCSAVLWCAVLCHAMPCLSLIKKTQNILYFIIYHSFLGPWANSLLKSLGVDLQLKVCVIHEIFES